MMKGWYVLLVILIAVMLVFGSNQVYAHYFDEEKIKTTADILKSCEFYYNEYQLMGEYNFLLQHPNHPKIRFCTVLYKHIVWATQHPARDKILIAEIEKLLGDSGFLKERHLNDFSILPQWVKSDAKLWVKGDITDSRFAYGIRAVVKSDLVIPTKVEPITQRSCDDVVCIEKSDYAIYSITDNYGKDIIVEKYTVKETFDDYVTVSLDRTSKAGRKTIDYAINKDGTFYDGFEKNRSVAHWFIYPVPLNVGNKFVVADKEMIIKHDIITTFSGLEREAFLAKDSSGKYVDIIDKKTGLVLSSKFEDVKIIPIWKKTELIETNMLEKQNGVHLRDLSIPKWLKKTTQWFIDGLISESEYLKAIEYLVDKNILRV